MQYVPPWPAHEVRDRRAETAELDLVLVVLLGPLQDVAEDGRLRDEVVLQLLLVRQTTLDAIEAVVVLVRELRIEERLVVVAKSAKWSS